MVFEYVGICTPAYVKKIQAKIKFHISSTVLYLEGRKRKKSINIFWELEGQKKFSIECGIVELHYPSEDERERGTFVCHIGTAQKYKNSNFHINQPKVKTKCQRMQICMQGYNADGYLGSVYYYATKISSQHIPPSILPGAPYWFYLERSYTWFCQIV